MKASKGLLILLVAVFLAVGYAVYDFQSDKSEEKTKGVQSLLLRVDGKPIEKDQIDQITIGKVGADAIRIDRTQEGWKLSQPLQEVADQKAVDDFVSGAALEHSHDLVKSKDVDWKIFGLDAPSGTILFHLNSGKETKISISAKKNFSGDAYVRVQDEDQVFTASSTWHTRLDKRPFDFRDRRLLRKSAGVVQKFTANKITTKKSKTSARENVTLEKKNNLWISDIQPKWKLDQSKVNDVVYMLNTVQIQDFVKEDHINDSDLKSYGLDHPLATMTVQTKDEQTWSIKFSMAGKKNEIFALTSEPRRIFKISATDLDKFEKIDLQEFRDLREPFDFNKDEVKKIHVTLGDLSADFERKGDDWNVLNPNKDLVYQVDRARAILALVRNLEVADFDPLPVAKPNAQEIRFLTAEGKPVLILNFEGSYKKPMGGMERNFIRARTSAYASAIGLDEGGIKSMGVDGLVAKLVSTPKPPDPASAPNKKNGQK